MNLQSIRVKRTPSDTVKAFIANISRRKNTSLFDLTDCPEVSLDSIKATATIAPLFGKASKSTN